MRTWKSLKEEKLHQLKRERNERILRKINGVSDEIISLSLFALEFLFSLFSLAVVLMPAFLWVMSFYFLAVDNELYSFSIPLSVAFILGNKISGVNKALLALT